MVVKRTAKPIAKPRKTKREAAPAPPKIAVKPPLIKRRPG
jgi:hypothetical protein